MNSFVESLINTNYLKTPRIIEAFKNIDRKDFLPFELENLANLNKALPIGYEQTISQPLTVAFMLELLQVEEGDKVLDIGSGSGWTTALLSFIVGAKGEVIALELIPELAVFGEKNVAKYNFLEKNIASFFCLDGSQAYKEKAPYDKILASASLPEGDIPKNWREQLKINGRLVFPMLNSIFLFIKKSKNSFEKFEYPGFSFVPFKK